jgi:ABC-type branched-subunit amino acid transport system ATPase component
MEKPLDLTKLKAMIKNGIASIPKDPNADQAVILIGDTGVGKSTVLAFLSGQELFVRFDGLKPILDCPNNKNIKIGHDKYS